MPDRAGLGAIEMDSMIAGVTENIVVPDIVPEVAVMMVEPTPAEVPSPEVPPIVATAGVPEVQLTLLVKSEVLVSLKVPVAANCCVRPFGMLGEAGVTVIDTSTRGDAFPPPHRTKRISSPKRANGARAS